MIFASISAVAEPPTEHFVVGARPVATASEYPSHPGTRKPHSLLQGAPPSLR